MTLVAPALIILAVILAIMTVGRIVFRPAPKGIDWALEVAFIRLDFPPAYRDVAQQIAAGLAEIVGMRIKQLRPKHDLAQIAEWSPNRIQAKDLIALFVVAFGVKCDAATTFGNLVERVAQRKLAQAEA